MHQDCRARVNISRRKIIEVLGLGVRLPDDAQGILIRDNLVGHGLGIGRYGGIKATEIQKKEGIFQLAEKNRYIKFTAMGPVTFVGYALKMLGVREDISFLDLTDEPYSPVEIFKGFILPLI